MGEPVRVPATTTLTTTPIAPDQAQRLFQCSTCKRSFTRVDHLTRHVRSHTRHKPYVCQVCTKGFARVDLLKRHVAGHSAENANKNKRSTTVRASRVIQACEACSQNHLRCEDEKPCSRCRKKSIECRVATPSAFDETEVNAAQDLLGLSSSFTTPADAHDTIEGLALLNESHDDAIGTSNDAPSSDRSEQEHDSGAIMPPPSYSHDDFTYDSTMDMEDPLDPLLSSYLRNVLPIESVFSGHASPKGPMDTHLHWDMDLNDLDLRLLDQYNVQAPFNPTTPSTDNPSADQQISASESSDEVVVRAEAFKNSVWRYLPQSNRDFAAAEQPNLAYAETARVGSPHGAQLISRRATQERMQQTTRDKLLTLVIKTTTPANMARIASSFPNIELLDSLIQFFLTSPFLDAQSWFHLPTFSPSKLRPELLACVIAAGAISTPDVPLRKLGFALQEASRAGQASAFEEDNSAIRSLQHLQNVLLQLDIGMWSGISRKMEISESFLQPLVTMLRRGGRFRRSSWKNIVPTHEDKGVTLEEKWKKWVNEELFLRLVHHAFEHDRQSSMALSKPPLISYSEMQLPLPCPDSIWHAVSAESWKGKMLSNPSIRSRPSPTDCLLDLSHLNQHEHASPSFLYMVWGMIWEYRQMAAVAGKSHIQPNNSLILSSRHQELTKYLEDFQVSSSTVFQSSKKATHVVLQLLLLHLNAPLEDMQLFAGVEGAEEARRAYPALKDWVITSAARQALLHAGQLLRIAGELSPGALRNFNAIAVYHASLILWAYVLLKRGIANNRRDTSSVVVCLDGEESLDSRRFVTLDQGIPAIRGRAASGAVIPISDTDGILQTLVAMLKNNHDSLEGSCPPLVDNLIQLMESLRSATK
ncbi:hypothetical protein EJ04DRAFT_546959 [Polyplosphaeria fusca]|uniref:Uncharacterized protein n=1 Tax=Polyplosphaeria fusca TaxID=682080 RepID=A0A9P4QMD9_9PLEO|nr:hypothetical protein EJ04DRAFT_546959 [Polyplosphaeria fusca]